MSSIAPQPIRGLRGTVSRGPYGTGSKSAREAVFIDTPNGRFLLRRKTGPAFGDDALDAYRGCTVECDGFLLGTTLLAEAIRIVSSAT